jgi:hypothetical protein
LAKPRHVNTYIQADIRILTFFTVTVTGNSSLSVSQINFLRQKLAHSAL